MEVSKIRVLTYFAIFLRCGESNLNIFTDELDDMKPCDKVLMISYHYLVNYWQFCAVSHSRRERRNFDLSSL